MMKIARTLLTSFLRATFFAMLCRANVFPYNQIAGLILEAGRPILGVPSNNFEPMAYMVADQMVQSVGYPVENHAVTTEDGYILTVHRIPHGQANASAVASVIIITGILTDGASFLMNTPENNVAFLLADAGYDVWLLNFRGGFYSRKHKFLNPDVDKKYWDFSMHEVGMHDLPATVDYVLGVTGRHQVYTVGYSMGGAETCIMLSEKPEYQKKVRASVIVAPAIRFRDPKFPIYYAMVKPLLQTLKGLLNDMEVLRRTPNMVSLYQQFCGGVGRHICLTFIDAIFGVDNSQFNDTRIVVYMSHMLSGTSVKVLSHYVQMYKGVFKQYDYGIQENIRIYGHPVPPDYPIKSIRSPILVMYGPGDTFVMPNDVIALSRSFQNLVGLIAIAQPTFNHLDFMCAKEAGTLFADVLIDELRKLDASVPVIN